MSCPYHYAMNASVIRAPAYPQIQFIITLKGSELLRLACNSLRIPTYSYCSGRMSGKLYVIDVFTKPLCFVKTCVEKCTRRCTFQPRTVNNQFFSIHSNSAGQSATDGSKSHTFPCTGSCPYSLPKISLLSVPTGCRERHSAIVGGENRRRARRLPRMFRHGCRKRHTCPSLRSKLELKIGLRMSDF